MLLGFSTGCLHKTHDRLSRETFDVFRKMGCDAIELSCIDIESAAKILGFSQEDFSGFQHVSIHAPSFDALDPEGVKKYKELLDIFDQAAGKIRIDAVVFHPDEIADWTMFDDRKFPVALENMDWRKERGKYAESMREIFAKKDALMVLDLNHCYTNDPSMRLAQEMNEAFNIRISEIHLSGFEHFHEPLFRTGQTEILESIPKRNLPIIIESVCDTVEDAEKEFEYVKSFLRK